MDLRVTAERACLRAAESIESRLSFFVSIILIKRADAVGKRESNRSLLLFLLLFLSFSFFFFSLLFDNNTVTERVTYLVDATSRGARRPVKFG